MIMVAADQPASGMSSEDVEQALAYLELLWGDAFTIGHDEQGFWATPAGQEGKALRADDPQGLGKLMEGRLAR